MKAEVKSKQLFVIIFSFIIVFFLTSLVAAADVAYIYRKDFRIDQNIVKEFKNLGLSVDLIQENKMPLNFSEYRIIFVGDENFVNPSKIPVHDNPSIIANYYHGSLFGLSDNEGVSQLASTDPLTVVTDNRILRVYTTARDGRGIALPYYYIDRANKAPALERIAATETTSSGDKFGDVISYVKAGSNLFNRKSAKENICFFGITKSSYWTADARKLFDDCIGFVLPEKKIKRNVAIADLSNSVNKIRIENTDGNDIMGNQLKCNEKYKISVNLKNIGESYENVTFSSRIGTLVFDHLPIENIAPEDSSLKTKTVNMTLSEGRYNISIKANIPEDSDQSDNLAVREVFLSCPARFVFCSSNSECYDDNPLTIDECINPGTTASLCRNALINCASNLDCGSDGFVGQEFCLEKEVSKNYQVARCINGGTSESYCSVQIEKRAVSICANACSQGVCIRCNGNIECSDNNQNTDDSCVNPGAIGSYCINREISDNIACNSNLDCGSDGFVDLPFCSGKDVKRKYRIFTCDSPGNTNSVCSSKIEERNIEQCSSLCENGMCSVLQGKHDISLLDFSNSKNKIRIEYQNGSDVLGDELLCNEKYKIVVKVKNNGDFYENISFNGSLGSVLFNHLPIENSAPSASSEKTRTINITLSEGNYALIVSAFIEGDSNLADNVAERNVRVSCSAMPDQNDTNQSNGNIEPFCVDSDAGADFYKKGNVSFLTKITQTPGSIRNSTGNSTISYGTSYVFDYCIDSETIVENSCLGVIQKSERFRCAYGCFEAACRSSVEREQKINSCSVLNIPNTLYKLERDILGRKESCFIIKADNITFDGQNHFIEGNSSFINYGIALENVKNAKIYNVFVNGFYKGIFFNKSSLSLVENSYFYNNSDGILLSSSSGNILRSNYLKDSFFRGIAIYNNSNENEVFNNTLIDGRDAGITIEVSNSNNISSNYLINNSEGILVSGKNNLVFRNIIRMNGNGVVLLLASFNLLMENLIRDNGYGLVAELSFNNSITKNTFFQNRVKHIEISRNSKDNRLISNNFL